MGRVGFEECLAAPRVCQRGKKSRACQRRAMRSPIRAGSHDEQQHDDDGQRHRAASLPWGGPQGVRCRVGLHRRPSLRGPTRFAAVAPGEGGGRRSNVASLLLLLLLLRRGRGGARLATLALLTGLGAPAIFPRGGARRPGCVFLGRQGPPRDPGLAPHGLRLFVPARVDVFLLVVPARVDLVLVRLRFR